MTSLIIICEVIASDSSPWKHQSVAGHKQRVNDFRLVNWNPIFTMVCLHPRPLAGSDPFQAASDDQV